MKPQKNIQHPASHCCPHCHYGNPAHVFVCSSCGTELFKQCRDCGQDNLTTRETCTACGALMRISTRSFYKLAQRKVFSQDPLKLLLVAAGFVLIVTFIVFQLGNDFEFFGR